MKYAVCVVPLAPFRKEPDHRAEMSSQILFGEIIQIEEINAEGWAFSKNEFDEYTGWCRMNQFTIMDSAFPFTPEFTAQWANEIEWNEQQIQLPFACNLSFLQSGLMKGKIRYEGKKIRAARAQFTEENIRNYTSVFLNTAYLWGGRSVFGIDCSGFVQSVFKLFDFPLLRDAKDQVSQGTEVGFLQLARCGDVAFFDDEEGKIVHVGILLNGEEIIHASGNVRIDKIDNEGILHSGTGLRTHHLRIIKRMID